MSLAHNARRFLSSLRPGGPARDEVEWAQGQLSATEVKLFERMSNPDRRHAVAVAREVERRMGHEATRPILAAALLHDVGKIDAGLRTYGRVVATICRSVAGEAYAVEWRRKDGFTRKVGLYIDYPQIGAERLELAGSDPLVVAWAREHHLPPEDWTVPPEIGEVLAAADR